MYVVFDLDGTLADKSHREYRIKEKPQDWDLFYADCYLDLPIAPAVATLKALVHAGHNVEIWSGRIEKNRRGADIRRLTVNWLFDRCEIRTKRDHPRNLKELHKPWNRGKDYVYVNALLMREEGDYTPDQVLKEEWLHAMKPRPDLVFDDRQKVVDMWRRNGIPCFQVAPGDF